MILPGGKYHLGQAMAEDVFRMEPGSEAAQLFAKLKQYEIADISQNESGKWHFKMLTNGYLAGGSLLAFFIIRKLRH